MTVFRTSQFKLLNIKISERFAEIDTIIAHVGALDSKARQGTSSAIEDTQLRIMKGYLILNLYAIIEFSYNEIISTGYRYISSKNVPIKTLNSQILAFAIEHKWKALIQNLDSRSYETAFRSKIGLVEEMRGTQLLTFNNSEKPRINGNFNAAHLEVVCTLLKINKQQLLPGNLADVPTIFGNITQERHHIAHGGKKIEDIGGKYSLSDIINYRNKIESFSMHFMREMSNYCVTRRYKK